MQDVSEEKMDILQRSTKRTKGIHGIEIPSPRQCSGDDDTPMEGLK